MLPSRSLPLAGQFIFGQNTFRGSKAIILSVFVIKKIIFGLSFYSKAPSPRFTVELPCEECDELRDTFSDLKWDSIQQTILDSNWGQLPLFSPAAFHYFLPAYILRCLDNFDPDNLICEFTLYSLCPTSTTEDDKKWHSERYQLFTEDQRKAIGSFLKLAKTSDEFSDFHDELQTGLPYWTSS